MRSIARLLQIQCPPVLVQPARLLNGRSSGGNDKSRSEILNCVKCNVMNAARDHFNSDRTVKHAKQRIRRGRAVRCGWQLCYNRNGLGRRPCASTAQLVPPENLASLAIIVRKEHRQSEQGRCNPPIPQHSVQVAGCKPARCFPWLSSPTGVAKMILK